MQGPGRNLEGTENSVSFTSGPNDEALGEGDGSDGGCHEPPTPLGVKVSQMVRQRDALAFLCNEMISTFLLPANKDRVAALGPEFPDILANWRKRFDEAAGR